MIILFIQLICTGRGRPEVWLVRTFTLLLACQASAFPSPEFNFKPSSLRFKEINFSQFGYATEEECPVVQRHNYSSAKGKWGEKRCFIQRSPRGSWGIWEKYRLKVIGYPSRKGNMESLVPLSSKQIPRVCEGENKRHPPSFFHFISPSPGELSRVLPMDTNTAFTHVNSEA